MRRRSILAAPAAALLAGGPAFAADTVRVGMLKPNIVTVIYWIAVRTGAFEKNGIEIAENPFPSGQTAAGIEQLIRGNLDFYLGASGEVAHAAVLCPSFYRARIFTNPTRWDRFRARIAQAVIGRLAHA